MASQFHPEFKSRPERPSPLFRGFIEAALVRAAEREGWSDSAADSAAQEASSDDADDVRVQDARPSAGQTPGRRSGLS